jgi:xanthine dehydrogenase accessory factor
METPISGLLSTVERERAAGRAVALAVVLRTDGSTYSKQGALMLITRSGECAGLLSGGCLEADLREHAREVIDSGTARQFNYDARAPEDLVFGMGSGCEGSMDIFLMRVGPVNHWEPFAHWQAALAGNRPTAVGLVVQSVGHPLEPGAVLLPGLGSELDTELAAVARGGEPQWLKSAAGSQIFALPLVLPRRILVLGAGPDAEPLVVFGVNLGWKLTLYDHRPAFADPGRFPGAEAVHSGRPEELAEKLSLDSYDAAVVMSHHLRSDAAYLRVLGESAIGYVGLLGPAPRRDRLRSALGVEFSALQPRLHSPVGLDLGGRTSASIALAIVAQIHAWLHARRGGSFSDATPA